MHAGCHNCGPNNPSTGLSPHVWSEGTKNFAAISFCPLKAFVSTRKNRDVSPSLQAHTRMRGHFIKAHFTFSCKPVP